jgi:hypothetical protein
MAMRKMIPLVVFLFIASIAFSQTQTLKGSLKDSSENRNLVNTVVSLLSKKDSVLVKFTRADKEGKFEKILTRAIIF